VLLFLPLIVLYSVHLSLRERRRHPGERLRCLAVMWRLLLADAAHAHAQQNIVDMGALRYAKVVVADEAQLNPHLGLAEQAAPIISL
jgi:hypothetical protein